jgi:heptosyltransferase II
MKLLIELPTWLGDSIMTTPAIENIVSHFKNVSITLIGSYIAIEAMKNHPSVIQTHVMIKTNASFYKTVKSLDQFDLFFSFRGSLRSRLLKLFITANSKFQYDKKKYIKGHQVEKYNKFINDSLRIDVIPGKLKLHGVHQINHKIKKTIGINAGASYGSAKRWYPKKFANVASSLAQNYDIVILGGENERDIADEIERNLIDFGVNNYRNLAAKTSIEELINLISTLDLFITVDSGPMHIAGALEIPTVTIFGPTNTDETSQWGNKKSLIVKQNLFCQPCMKRVCPLGHHNCMKQIKSLEVLDAVEALN